MNKIILQDEGVTRYIRLSYTMRGLELISKDLEDTLDYSVAVLTKDSIFGATL